MRPSKLDSPSEAGEPDETAARPVRSLRTPLVIAISVALVLAGGQLFFWRANARTNNVALSSLPKRVTMFAAERASYRPTREYVGTLRPWIEAKVGPQLVTAYVATVLVRPGAKVARGAVLATLDCRNANASSQSIAQQARALEARERAISSQAARVGALLDGGFASTNEVEQQRAESEGEQARLLATRAQLVGSSLAVDDCILRAPFDGEVDARLADPGSFARPGVPLVSVVDRSIIRIAADVPETDFEAVAPGTQVQIHLLANGADLRGTVSRRSPSADPATRTVHMEIDLPNAAHTLPANTTAQLTIEVGEPQDALQVPLIAADISGTKASVFVVHGGVAKNQVLRVLGEHEGFLFLSPDLPVGTLLVTEGRPALNEGDHVEGKVVPASSASVAAGKRG